MGIMDIMCDVWNEQAREKAKKELNEAIKSNDKEAEEKARKKIKECNQYELDTLWYECMKD